MGEQSIVFLVCVVMTIHISPQNRFLQLRLGSARP